MPAVFGRTTTLLAAAVTTGEVPARFTPSAIRTTFAVPVDWTASMLCRLIPKPLDGAVPVIWIAPATDLTPALEPLTRTPSLLVPAPPVPSSVIVPAPASADVDRTTAPASITIPNVSAEAPAPRPVRLDIARARRRDRASCQQADSGKAARGGARTVRGQVDVSVRYAETCPTGETPARTMFPSVATARFDVPKLEFPWNVTPVLALSRTIEKLSEYALPPLSANTTPAAAAESVMLIVSKRGFSRRRDGQHVGALSDNVGTVRPAPRATRGEREGVGIRRRGQGSTEFRRPPRPGLTSPPIR